MQYEAWVFFTWLIMPKTRVAEDEAAMKVPMCGTAPPKEMAPKRTSVRT